jgi:hypothetical protein
MGPGGKALAGRDADHSPPFSVEVINEYELYLLSPCAFIGVLWDCFTLPCPALLTLYPVDFQLDMDTCTQLESTQDVVASSHSGVISI